MNTVFFSESIERDTLFNSSYRRVVHTLPGRLQLALMSLAPGESIPLETHGDTAQFIRVESGIGIATIDGVPYALTDGGVVIVPPSTPHLVENISPTIALKLYTLYTPPEHADGRRDERQPRPPTRRKLLLEPRTMFSDTADGDDTFAPKVREYVRTAATLYTVAEVMQRQKASGADAVRAVADAMDARIKQAFKARTPRANEVELSAANQLRRLRRTAGAGSDQLLRRQMQANARIDEHERQIEEMRVQIERERTRRDLAEHARKLLDDAVRSLQCLSDTSCRSAGAALARANE